MRRDHHQLASLKKSAFAPYAPLKLILSFIIITFSLVIWGPVEYYMFPMGKTALFIFSVILAMVVGYTYGVATGVSPAKSGRVGGEVLVRRLFDFSLIVSIIALLISIGSAILSGQLNTDISTIGDAYASGYENYERNAGSYSLTFIIYSLSLPFNFISIVLGLYYFFSLGKIRQISVLFLIIASLLFYIVGSGKQKQLGDIIIYIISIAAIKYGVRRKPIKIKWIALAAVFGVVGLMAFVAILGQRYSVLGVDIANINQRINDRVYFDRTHPVFTIFGPSYGLNLAMFSTYLSQGYYGLGLSLETDWKWTHFLGFSYSISVIANRLFGVEWEWPNTLIVQVANSTGWDESKWNTIFPYYATDFTFPGTVVIFGYFAYVYARAWNSAIKYENPFSILVFSLLTMGALFIPANNQLLHSPGGLFTTALVTALYLTFGRQFNRPSAPWSKPKKHRRIPRTS